MTTGERRHVCLTYIALRWFGMPGAPVAEPVLACRDCDWRSDSIDGQTLTDLIELNHEHYETMRANDDLPD